MNHPAKLETAKGGMDALPIRIFPKVLPHACGHLYCVARQGTLIFHNPHPHKAESTAVQTCVRMRAIYQYAFRCLRRHTSRLNELAQHAHARHAERRVSAPSSHAHRARRPHSSSLLGRTQRAIRAAYRMRASLRYFRCT
jgi:hypothetical protein